MTRSYLVFGDIDGKLDVLRVECTRCDRKGRYSVAKLIAKHRRRGNLMKWRDAKRRLSEARRDRTAQSLRLGVSRPAEGIVGWIGKN